jgi:hypothetical protein
VNAYRTQAAGPGLDRTFGNAPVLRPLSIGEIIDVAIKLYRNNAGTLLKAVAIVVVPVQIVSAFIQVSALPDFNDPAFSPIQTPSPGSTDLSSTIDTSFIWASLAAFGLTFLLNIVASQLATAASLRAVSEAYLGEPTDWRTSLRFAFQRLGPLMWLAVLSTLGVGLGFILCIVPGVWLMVSWAVSIPVLLFEGVRGTGALRRSFSLVKGRWWPVLGATLLGQLIAGILGFVFQIPFSVLSFVGESEVALFAGSAISTALSQTLATPFIGAMTALIYFDLRVRKEGFDLELLAQHVGTPPGDEPDAPATR